jgi:hypothetical protein
MTLSHLTGTLRVWPVCIAVLYVASYPLAVVGMLTNAIGLVCIGTQLAQSPPRRHLIAWAHVSYHGTHDGAVGCHALPPTFTK